MESLIRFWQHLPAHIDPVIVQFGAFQLRYYGLMYLLAFLTTYALVRYRIRSERLPFSVELIEDYFVWAILGLLIGARFGYALFYQPSYFLQHPLEIVLPFEWSSGTIRYTGISGMSYHGGLLGVLASSLLFCRRRGIGFWAFGDLLCPAIPLGYTFGRIGNFINGELYGRITTVPWGMYFPSDPTGQLRHPSQLYEGFFEGLFLFAVLWGFRRKKVFQGFFVALYLVGYGTVRFLIEFFREPDIQMGFLFGLFTAGQVLCLVMIFVGAGIMVVKWSGKKSTSRAGG